MNSFYLKFRSVKYKSTIKRTINGICLETFSIISVRKFLYKLLPKHYWQILVLIKFYDFEIFYVSAYRRMRLKYKRHLTPRIYVLHKIMIALKFMTCKNWKFTEEVLLIATRNAHANVEERSYDGGDASFFPSTGENQIYRPQPKSYCWKQV